VAGGAGRDARARAASSAACRAGAARDLARDRVAPALARVRWRGMGAVVVRARSGRRAC
jgi:hypothetical protein